MLSEDARLKRNAYQREWNQRRKQDDPGWSRYYDPEYDRNYHLKKKYGLSGTAFQAMLDEQGGLCAICDVEPATCVDHNHTTEEVRAVLCRKCNTGIGQFSDDPALVDRSAAYLRRFA